MCDPLTIAGFAASAAGTMYDQKQQQKNINRGIEARNAATADNFARQDMMQERADAEFADILKKFDPSTQREGEVRDRKSREALSTSAVKSDGTYSAGGGNAPSVVKNEINRVAGDTTAKSKAAASRTGAVAALGDPRFKNAIDLGRSRGDLATTSDFAGGVARLLPLEQSAAVTNAYKPIGPLGAILKLGGQAATLGGVSGAGPSWGDIFGNQGFTAANNSAILAPQFQTIGSRAFA